MNEANERENYMKDTSLVNDNNLRKTKKRAASAMNDGELI